jgi:hypothetical protein
MNPDLLSGLFGSSAIVLALAALVNTIAYVLRKRVDISADLVQSMILRVNELEVTVRRQAAEIRMLEGRILALIDENEGLRDSISLGRVLPERVARRDDRYKPGDLTSSIAKEQQ